MLVKDEADVIGYTVEHLLGQVDHVIVQDNASTDGTADLLEAARVAASDRLEVFHDPDPAYYQDRKTSALVQVALSRGFRWALPCDADEFWYATDGRTAAAFALACAQAGVPMQRYEHRADLPCVSTIGPMTSARTGIPTVDVGAAQLAMHSARELMGVDDVAAYSAALQAFLYPA